MQTLPCCLQALQTKNVNILCCHLCYVHTLSMVPLATLITANHKTTKLMIGAAELTFIGIDKYIVQSKGTNLLVS